jgi:glyoxylase-like metal-dependent hydrolase (beta-lactamase superfamily II)
MSLPFALDHINLWLIRDRVDGVEGWCVVDCCLDNPTARAQWEQVFTTSLMGLPVLRVIATHLHPDHLGLAHWLCNKFKAPLLISATEYQSATLSSNGTSNFGGVGTQEFFTANGWTDPEDQAMSKIGFFITTRWCPRCPRLTAA